MKADFSFFRKKSVMIVLLLFALGLLLISFAQKEGTNSQNKSNTLDTQEYVLTLEEKTENMICAVDGVESANVCITLENGAESVFAVDKNGQSSDYITVRNSNGDEEGLEVTVNLPSVKGVAVIYSGEKNIKTKSEIISLVTALLDVTSNRVYVGNGK